MSMTQKQRKALEASKNFVTIFELARRGYAVGITDADRVRIVGCNPTMANIKPEHVNKLRAAVEAAEVSK